MAVERKGWYAALVAVGLSVLAGACIGYRGTRPTTGDRGIVSAHAVHGEQGLACTDCHSWEEGERVVPGHELCSICHDINEEAEDKTACNYCHTRDDQSVDPLVKQLSIEVKWEHPVHFEKVTDCLKCHSEPGVIPDLPRGPLKPWCMDCHRESEPKLIEDGSVDTAFRENECRVCHNELDRGVIPRFRGGARVPHDVPAIWEQVHGQESRVDSLFCVQCHESEAECQQCHRLDAPSSHTPSWRRKTHGLHATWDRAKCSMCHEEDMCIQCHENSEPASHQGGWTGPANQHCASCHFPPQRTSCVTCHPDIDHARAMPSPHNLGIFPPRCGLCHPGGLPHRAPHPLNSTARCIVCHR